MRVVLASANTGKLRELAALLAPLGWHLVPQQQLGIVSAPETGSTFLENALIKARHAARAAKGPALADDSGIEVDALGGAPGVRSARYANEHATDRENLEKLLAALIDVASEQRTARYRCAIAYVASAEDPHPLIGEGVWEGRIATTPRGHGGFGYDPIFIPAAREDSREDDRTAAQLQSAEKSVVSHRARALAQFQSRLAPHADGNAAPLPGA